MRTWIAGLCLALALPGAAAPVPRLRDKAPRGNAGKPPPQSDAEWLAFNGTVSAAHASGWNAPDHQQPVPLSGLLPTAAHPSTALTQHELSSALVGAGAAPAIAQRAAAHVMLGLPSGASVTATDDHLIARNDVVISYSSSRKSPNWVSWTTTRDHVGAKSFRSNAHFRADPSLPRSFGYAAFHDYERSGYDPGHMVPSGDRTANTRANIRTYVTSNTVPQAFNNNRGPWLDLERHVRDEVLKDDLQAHVIAGGVYGKTPLTIGNGVPVPAATWKIVVFLKRGQTLAEVDRTTRVVSVLIPNNDVEVGPLDPFQKYLTTPGEIERRTGLRFFSALPRQLADQLRTSCPAPGACR
jgi:endonuclease G, mitochondrial